VPPEVVHRAQGLLPGLWAKGAGTKQTELVGSRWITFQAQYMRGAKRGVVAYRVKGSGPLILSAFHPKPRAAAPTSALSKTIPA
jgi:hypothetical protein